tara:strand:+ start:280 stop:1203 length:924 start_codon:yes stop_codon:yes gene_type:complete
MDNIKIQAPATIANLSCGFDILGLCVSNPYDEIEIIKTSNKNISLQILDSKYSNIPDNPDQNTGGVPAKLIQKDFKLDFGFRIKIKKGIPLCGGLGSSAATSVGVVFGINQLLDLKLSQKELLKYAMEGEKVSVSNPHADNVAPCLIGGLTLIRDTKTLDISTISISQYHIALINPDIKIKTEDARNILPEKIQLETAIKQWGNVGALVYGFVSKDNQLIKRSMNDFVIEPVRSKLINGFYEIKKISLEMGAIGAGISGSGPTMFALFESKKNAENVIKLSKQYYESINMRCNTFLANVNMNGPIIL